MKLTTDTLETDNSVVVRLVSGTYAEIKAQGPGLVLQICDTRPIPVVFSHLVMLAGGTICWTSRFHLKELSHD